VETLHMGPRVESRSYEPGCEWWIARFHRLPPFLGSQHQR
jgi:hypothetical protein